MSLPAADIAPARVGDVLRDIDTPACVVDIDSLSGNIRRAVAYIRAHAPSVTIRPHAKSHKCVEIAKLQIALSEGLTTGVCCQKLVEAEAMVAAGVTDVLVSNEIVGKQKIARLIRLAQRSTDVKVLVDNADNVRDLAAAAADAGIVLKVLIEVDVGQRRCGVADIEAAVTLGRLIVSLPSLLCVGIQTYHGAAQHVRSDEDRREIASAVSAKAAGVRDALVAAGVPCNVVTGAGTGTFEIESMLGVFTEVQPGSYIFNDADYAANLDKQNVPLWASWTPSLFLLTTVMSIRRNSAAGEEGWLVVDSGLKAQSTDSGLPVPYATVAELASGKKIAYDVATGASNSVASALKVKSVSDEHSTLIPKSADRAGIVDTVALGEKFLLVPGHCDPFVNHFDWIIAVKDGKVEAVWRLHARSPGI